MIDFQAALIRKIFIQATTGEGQSLNRQMSSNRTRQIGFTLGAAILGLVILTVACARDTGTPLAHVRAQTASAPLHVNSANPRYFTDAGGKAVYLAGAHTWSNLLDRGSTKPLQVAFDYDAYIRWMVSHNFNFMRLWTAELPDHGRSVDPYDNVLGSPWRWFRTGPGLANDGEPKFDLARADQRYFDRLRSRVLLARDNGIYVAIMLFNGFEWQFETNPKDGNPFEITNNVNGVDCPATCPSDGSRIPKQAWEFQQAYIRKVVDAVNDLNNVLFEVSNESGAPYSNTWQASVISLIKQYEKSKPKQHPIGMTFQWKGGADKTLFDSAADWISPNERLPAGNGSKVIINDTDHSYGWQELKRNGRAAQRAWVWENFMLGNSVLFMDPYLVVWPERNSPGGSTADPHIGATPDDYWNVIRDAIGSTLTYANRMNLVAMTPQPALSSTRYCLANPGSEYLAYQPRVGSITMNLLARTYEYEWLDPSTNKIRKSGVLSVSAGDHLFIPSFIGDSVLYLKVR